MVESVAHVLGVEAPKGHIPIYLARLFTTLFELKASVLGGTPQMTQEMITGFTGNLNVDISKAMNELDYEPKVDLVKGMTETAQWYEKNGYL